MLTLIAAVSADGFISTGQGMPWHLPRDTAHFRRTTRTQWLLVGRRTHAEMLGWFHDHHVLVLTHDLNLATTIGTAVSSVTDALSIAAKGGAAELFVCGGGATYAAAMPLADRLILTHVDTVLRGGVPFPPLDLKVWLSLAQQKFPPDDKNAYGMCFTTYERLEDQTARPGILENSR